LHRTGIGGGTGIRPYARRVNDLRTSNGSRPAPAKVLIVVAHPDDVDFGASGTVAALTEAGTDVAYCLVTSGDAGSDHLPIDRDELIALREREQTEAAAAVGVPAERITFLRHADGLVEPTAELRRDISAAIRRERPDVVITQSPERNYERIYASHPDHLAAGEATLRAVYPDARNPRAFPELLAGGLEPHAVGEVWLMAMDAPNLFVDITDTFPRKVAALRAHDSQTSRIEDLDGFLRGWATGLAEAAGLPAGRLAEGFRIVATA
jgi:LmbE family N-acetylglucosaminyl deacetylase